MKARRVKPKKREPATARKPQPIDFFLSAEVEHLREKYQTLCTKYTQLVKKFAMKRMDHIAVFALAKWAMQTDSSGIAVVHEGKLEVLNDHFRELCRLRGAWRRVGPDPEAARTFDNLRELVLAEAQPLLRAQRGAAIQPAWVRRYVREGSGDVVEVRFEHHLSPSDDGPRITALILDVTERAGAEEELIIARSHLGDNRLRALGELASGMAHDLNNTLGALSLRLELLANDPACRDAQPDNIEAIRRICSDASARVRRLQDFGRRRHDHPLETVDLAQIVRQAIDLAQPEMERTAQLQGVPLGIEARLPRLPAVYGDASDLRHVFINLFLNARDAMPKGGKIDVAAWAAGQRIHITVSDDGVGIPESHLERIFDPFFTTKGERGTGLGLAIAAAVMARHDGVISAHNRAQGGAIFELEIPIAPVRRLTASTPALLPARLTPQRVLIIDDDPEHLTATQKVLEQAGQQVTIETSGRVALERFHKGEEFDVVLCDIGMPDMNGWDVARAIATESPTTPVFMISGWANEIADNDPRRAFVAGVLAKPVSTELLHRALAGGGVRD